MKCSNCGKELPDTAKFCWECGQALPQPLFPSGNGNNVIAGDIVSGNLDKSKHFGAEYHTSSTTNNTVNNTTNNTVINQDETKKVVNCHICGKNITIVQAITCPSCRQASCEDCYDFSKKLCKKCVEIQREEKEEIYKKALSSALEKGRMFSQDREKLNLLKQQLGIAPDRALELEAKCKSEYPSREGNTNRLTPFEISILGKTMELLWNAGDSNEAWKFIDSVYQQHPFNEEVVSLRLYCAKEAFPQKEFQKILTELQCDVLAAYLTAADLAMSEGDPQEAERQINVAEKIWPGNYLLICRKALNMLAMADVLGDEFPIHQALSLMLDAPDPKDKLERSWKIRTMNSIAFAFGENADKLISDVCREKDVFYQIASNIFVGKTTAEEKQIAKKLKFAEKLLNGDGVEKDEKAAVAILHKIVDSGNACAQFLLGKCYHFGLGIEKNKKEAVKWYRKAADQGNDKAQNNLGNCFYYGGGIEKDDEEAVKWYRKAAEQGNAKAQNSLGNCFYYGYGVEENKEAAVKWYRKAAEQGNALAQDHLGDCYYDGSGGLDQDYAEAVEWYRKAVEQDMPDAQYDLGWCYEHEQGVKKDIKKALLLYKTAAEQGLPKAQYRLGWLYKNGEGVNQSFPQAYKWYEKAAQQGYAKAQKALKEWNKFWPRA